MEFGQLVVREEFGLAEACLLLARDERPRLDVGDYLGRLDAWAADVRGLVRGGATPRGALARVLFDEAGFRGNDQDYYDPDNSHLDQVIERRVGLPITLSIVYMEVARRAGDAVVGVGLPGHFLVRHVGAWAGAHGLLVDPFHQGRVLAEEDAQALVDGIYDGRLRVKPADLAPTPDRDIVARVAKNLELAWLRRGDATRALRAVERVLEVRPFAPDEWRDRGVLLRALGRLSEARASLEAYLKAMPTARDRRAVESMLAEMTP